MTTHLMVEDSINIEFCDAKSIELINVSLKDIKGQNITDKNNTIFWSVLETDGTHTQGSTIFSSGFFSLEDIQITLNNDLRHKGCSVTFLFRYDEIMKKITIIQIKPPTCKISVFLLGKSLIKSLGFNTDWLIAFPVTNNDNITFFPYGTYKLFCNILDSSKNYVNGKRSQLLCELNYPFNVKPITKTTSNRFSQVNFNVYDFNGNECNFFQFSCTINGE